MTPPSANERATLIVQNHDITREAYYDIVRHLRAAEAAARAESETEDHAAWLVLHANGVPMDFDGSTAEAVQMALEHARAEQKEADCLLMCRRCAEGQALIKGLFHRQGTETLVSCDAYDIRAGGEKERET